MSKRANRLFELGERIPDLKLEKKIRRLGFEFIAGVDEAGRGPLAGPVVAGAVILPARIRKGSKLWLVRDSKKLKAKDREELFDLILKEAMAVGIGEADSREIDQFNIFQASLLAMERAVAALPIQPEFCLVDGIRALSRLPSQAVKKGDLICLSIASASIIAKVSRDRKMLEYHRQYPHYQFEKNKGYGTAEHQQALREYGPCEIHRRSFEPVRACVPIGTKVPRTVLKCDQSGIEE